MNKDDTGENIRLTNEAENSLPLHQSRNTLIYCLHTLLDQFELHLDGIIKKYKIMTITLLLATVAAIGYSFSVELKALQINKLLLSSLICFFGIIGITSIWYVDINVYHKFWGAFFIESVKMEKKFHFLIDIGDVSESLDSVRARIYGNGNFYIFLNIILLVTLGIVLSFFSELNLFKVVIFIILGILCVVTIVVMRRFCKKILNQLDELRG
ncbi:MAG: hypothetical protein K1000chlam2_00089 [Chlamydiae bacterium]|nr:hypothetical protein [Chlamydiota bacterium]